MKNRNIPYYMAVLALAAGMSTSFVSCVDTEEPDSIVTLRNAKAEEIKAEAKVQEALAGLKDAEAAYKKAEERAKIADAVTTELANKLTEAKNNLEIAKLTAKNDIEISTAKEEAQAALDEAKNKAAVALEGYAVSLEEAKLAA
jgi:L-lysine 2,3-aminomutase